MSAFRYFFDISPRMDAGRHGPGVIPHRLIAAIPNVSIHGGRETLIGGSNWKNDGLLPLRGVSRSGGGWEGGIFRQAKFEMADLIGWMFVPPRAGCGCVGTRKSRPLRSGLVYPLL